MLFIIENFLVKSFNLIYIIILISIYSSFIDKIYANVILNNSYSSLNGLNSNVSFVLSPSSSSSSSHTGIISDSINSYNSPSQNLIKSTFDVLYMVPENLDDVLNLNEKHTIGNEYDKGWILPSDQPLSLFLYMYYDGHDENKIKPFLKTNVTAPDSSSSGLQLSNDQNIVQQPSSYSSPTLYLFFTPEKNCEDYMKRNYWPFEIVERIASNMYKAKLNSISLVYSNKPLYICMQQFDSDENIHDQFRYYSHQGDDYWVSIITTKSLLPTWARIVLFVVLLSLSGLFSGLNLGLMSLDLSELEILKRIGTASEKSYATKIYPLRKRGNFLLCTILLGNVLVNSVSTLILGDMLSGIYAAFGSTILIVIFGEIIPQSACSKHGLAVGAYTRYIMYLFMILTCPLSFPLSIILDKVLGQEITATYSREKIREVMNVVEGLDDKEKKIISGALDFNNKKVREVMTKLEGVFMLEVKSCLDFEAIAKIAQEGFSRIPVYEGQKENIVGLLHVKDFTLLDPDDNMPVEALLKFYNHVVIFCDAEESIDERFEEFRKGETHLAFVNDVIQQPDKDPVKTCVGIVTLEDIIEALVQMEIYDEFDDKKEIEREEKKLLDESSNNKEFESVFINNADSVISNNFSSNRENTRLNSTSSTGFNLNLTNHISPDQSDKIKQNTFNDTNSSINKTQKSNLTHPSYESQTSKDLSFFLQQQKESSHRTLISPQIRFVMFQFLFTTVKPFTNEYLTKNVLELIFTRAIFKESRRSDPKLPREYLYKYGKGCNYFILILSGEATIEVGKEKLEFPAGPFAYFGVNALLCDCENADQISQDESHLNKTNTESPGSIRKFYSKQYVPDFSLRVDDKCVYMKIDRALWRNGVIKSRLERINNQKSDSIDYLPTDAGTLTADSDLNSKTDFNPGQQFMSSSFNLQPTNSTKSKRSASIAVNVLAKAQEATLKNNKDVEMSSLRNQNYKLQTLNKVKETDINFEKLSINNNENIDKLEYENFRFSLDDGNQSISIDIDNEREPFILKKNSTSSLDINSSSTFLKSDKLADKYQTMSQNSLNHQ